MAGSGNAHLRNEETVLTVRDLVVDFPVGRGKVLQAVSGVSFDVLRGETLGIMGESGCGKSTTGRAILSLPPPTSGSVQLSGVDLSSLDRESLRGVRRRVQMIFQDPISSLNPRRQVQEIVAEGLRVWRDSVDPERVEQAMLSVGLDPIQAGNRRPHEFSGGQCQRIAIARALALDPEVIICDEPVSALDVSVQAQILNLLEDLKRRFGLTLVFISHDAAVVKNISDRVLVMYLGKVCEVAPTKRLYSHPAHPYTRALLASIPGAELDLPPAVELIEGDPPSPVDPPSGCRFRTRCPRAQDLCAEQEPKVEVLSDEQAVACHFPHTDRVLFRTSI